jgi:hypothetical protein
MPKFFKPSAVYFAGGMLRWVSHGKPVEMQFTDDEEVYSVSTDTNLKAISPTGRASTFASISSLGRLIGVFATIHSIIFKKR